jgi:predicted transcriptional regulator
MPGKTYRRSRLELYLDVLKAIHQGRQAPSRVVYAANLSYDRVINCINFLIDQNLIAPMKGTTKKR